MSVPKKHINTFSGIDSDTSVNKYDNIHYKDAQNIRIRSNDSLENGAITNVVGNTLKQTFSGGEILGYTNIRDVSVLFVYFDTDDHKIYKYVEATDTLTLLYPSTGTADFGWSTSNPIRAIGRYESEDIQKVYWVDGINPIRYCNIEDSGLGTQDIELFDIIPSASLSTPTIDTIISGGEISNGTVQYAYQLYSKNGAETVFSDASKVVRVTNTSEDGNSNYYGGGVIGEDSGKSISVTIASVDTDYSRLRLVSLNYITNELAPSVNIVAEVPIESTTTDITIVDTGNYVGSYSLEEFRLLGTVDYIPSVLATKDNILFFGDVQEEIWYPSWLDTFDTRMYDFYSGPTPAANIYQQDDSVFVIEPVSGNDYTDVPVDHDCICKNNRDTGRVIGRFQSDGTTRGAEGLNFKLSYETNQVKISDNKTNTEDTSLSNISQDIYNPVIGCCHDEVYRIGIVFRNAKGLTTPPKWMCDVRIPNIYEEPILSDSGENIFAEEIIPKVTLKTSFPSDVVSWQIVRSPRLSKDKSVLAQGVASKIYLRPTITYWTPYAKFDEIVDSQAFNYKGHEEGFPSENDDNIFEFISPETSFKKLILSGESTYIHQTGFIDDLYSEYNVDPGGHAFGDVKYTSIKPLNSQTSTDVEEYIKTDTIRQASEITYYLDNATINYIPKFIGVSSTGQASQSGYVFRTTSDLVTYSAPGYTLTDNASRLISLKQDVTLSRYGGITYNSRTYSEYIGFSSEIQAATVNASCIFGDSYIRMFTIGRGVDFDYGVTGKQTLATFPVETSIDLFYRKDQLQRYSINPSTWDPAITTYLISETVTQGIELWPDSYPEELGDLYRYDDVYNSQNYSRIYRPLAFDADIITKSDTRIISTQVKTNNEYTDSWTKITPANSIEVDSDYGAIKRLHTFNNNLMFFQESGIGIASVNYRSLIRDSSQASLALGTGDVLERYDYITTRSGIQSYDALVRSRKLLYYLDQDNKRIYQLTNVDNPVSEIKGVNSILKNSDLTSVISGYDPLYNEILFTFDESVSSDITLSFDEFINNFTTKYSYIPDKYLLLDNKLYTSKGESIYKHDEGTNNTFYGTADESYITLIINPNGNIVNVFDNMCFRFGDVQITSVEFDNSYQTSSLTITGSNLKHRFRQWRLQIPRETNSRPSNPSNYKPRLVDTYLQVKLIYDGTGDFILHDVVTFYRESKS